MDRSAPGSSSSEGHPGRIMMRRVSIPTFSAYIHLATPRMERMGNIRAEMLTESLLDAQNSSTMFQSLMTEKRGGDAAAAARRQSFSDQRPNTGFLGQMWYNRNWLVDPTPHGRQGDDDMAMAMATRMPQGRLLLTDHQHHSYTRGISNSK
ncbi:hypothetical protein MKZ38_006454 [Zalerion maritima]|uniref:Uncharacterized protein n=1 Tax=Zalerion maritima TaxID=339359 RepID=A0AAD5RWH1_9PEZI|nr:hypothetical protein MKZ38_006454 [Zalerion maritima]